MKEKQQWTRLLGYVSCLSITVCLSCSIPLCLFCTGHCKSLPKFIIKICTLTETSQWFGKLCPKTSSSVLSIYNNLWVARIVDGIAIVIGSSVWSSAPVTACTEFTPCFPILSSFLPLPGRCLVDGVFLLCPVMDIFRLYFFAFHPVFLG